MAITELWRDEFEEQGLPQERSLRDILNIIDTNPGVIIEHFARTSSEEQRTIATSFYQIAQTMNDLQRGTRTPIREENNGWLGVKSDLGPHVDSFEACQRRSENLNQAADKVYLHVFPNPSLE